MLQVLKKEFDKVDNLIKYVNEVSIRFGHLKDYEILKGLDKYIVIMKFDVPETKQFLELANLKEDKPVNSQHITELKYNIKLEDGSRDTYSLISFNGIKSGLEVKLILEDSVLFDLVFKVQYDNNTDTFSIELYNFKFDCNLIGWYTETTETLLVKIVDYNLLYQHLQKLLFNRGYILDFISLKGLERAIYYNAYWLNKKHFNN